MTSSRPPQAPDLELDAGPSPLDHDTRWAIETLLARGEPVWLTARGNSMRPLIAPGARIEVQPVRLDALCVGDVALCKVGERLVLHRVCKLQPDALVLCGDNQRVAQRVDAAQVLGRLASGTGRLPLLDALPLLDTRPLFRRMGRARLPAARLLNVGWRALVVVGGPVQRAQRRLRRR